MRKIKGEDGEEIEDEDGERRKIENENLWRERGGRWREASIVWHAGELRGRGVKRVRLRGEKS